MRIENHAHYAGLDDAFDIAGMYAEAIARGHVFNDGNKRTALACALAYLREQGITLPASPELEELTVLLAESKGKDAISGKFFGQCLWFVWKKDARAFENSPWPHAQ